MIPVVNFVGFSGSGKTTLITKVIKKFKEKGLRVAAIKHDAHKFEIDHEGKDTWNFSQAGADVVLINSQKKLAMIEKLVESLSFQEVLSKINGVDIIIVEGYKQEFSPKILLVRREKDLDLLSKLDNVIAVATSLSLKDIEIPIFNINDVEGITEIIQLKILGESIHGTR
ncbi:molybdopterin-guanine dinucleotide biosynthesis protein B [Vulcanibacillus modesticaldus]|uniref:Molybdopterin-guanine dinucleotide biosynthesis protein B n=2 Tax=Vulcanibacillus modesticaldus TaxID=337097 RepID=A0A1D2YWY1_9BACI|nr:molybdopterin-guanine dinucleotide biosynthesis protein B [Vulcanibacillus modesticaldus]